MRLVKLSCTLTKSPHIIFVYDAKLYFSCGFPNLSSHSANFEIRFLSLNESFESKWFKPIPVHLFLNAHSVSVVVNVFNSVSVCLFFFFYFFYWYIVERCPLLRYFYIWMMYHNFIRSKNKSNFRRCWTFNLFSLLYLIIFSSRFLNVPFDLILFSPCDQNWSSILNSWFVLIIVYLNFWCMISIPFVTQHHSQLLSLNSGGCYGNRSDDGTFEAPPNCPLWLWKINVSLVNQL